MSEKEDILTFYHFTRPVYVPIILSRGLRKGDIPLSQTTGFNAVWLSKDPNHLKALSSWDGDDCEKRNAGFKLQLAASDPNLKKWTDVARMYKMDPGWYRRLNETRGYGADSWWVYRGKITNESFQSVCLRVEGSESYIEYPPRSDSLLNALLERGYLVTALFLEHYPEPETGWPERKICDRKCANPHCREGPKVKAAMTCSRCHGVQYHNRACQKQDWKEHKLLCFDITSNEEIVRNLRMRSQPQLSVGSNKGLHQSPYHR
jgi:hypothetical protein